MEKVLHRKTPTLSAIVGGFCMIKKGTNKYVNKIPGNLNLYKIQKMDFADLSFSIRVSYEYEWKK